MKYVYVDLLLSIALAAFQREMIGTHVTVRQLQAQNYKMPPNSAVTRRMGCFWDIFIQGQMFSPPLLSSFAAFRWPQQIPRSPSDYWRMTLICMLKDRQACFIGCFSAVPHSLSQR